MKNRWHFLIAGGILLIGLIFGSIFDYQINEAIFSLKNGFGLVVSSFGMIPGYGTLSFMGGLLTYLALKNKEFKTWLKIILIACSAAMLGCSVYFLGKDVFSVNGFENAKIYWLGFVIMGVLMCPVFYLGYWLGKKNTNPKLWIIILIMAGVIFVALVPGVTLFKSIMHRPRYRFVVHDGLVSFHNWWERFSEYSSLKSGEGVIIDGQFIPKEEFKSFPSGHAAATMCGLILLSYLPLVDKRLMKYQTLLFYAAFGWGLVVMFARSLVGAHFLSDTCFGAIITLVCFYIGNEIVVRLFLKEEEPKPLEEE